MVRSSPTIESSLTASAVADPSQQKRPTFNQQQQYQHNSYFNGRGRGGRFNTFDRRIRPNFHVHSPAGFIPQSPSSSPTPSGGDMDHPVCMGQTQMDAEQMYIISGPFTCQGQPTMIAYPIPRGATVIATPAMRGMPISPSFPMNPSIQHSPGVNLEARPFAPPSPVMTQDSPQTLASPQPAAGIRSPSALVWNAHSCPEGRLIPLRQMQPPVYFYQDQHQNQTTAEPLNVEV